MRVVIGQGSCGIATGAKKTAAEFEKQIAEKNISNVTLGVTGCVGTCYLEPIVDVYDDDGKMTRYVKVQPDKVEKIVEEHLMQHQVAEDQAITEEDKEFVGKQQRVVLRNCGVINPENIEDYIAVDGYKAIEKVLTSMKPEEVIEEIKVSGLRGGFFSCSGGSCKVFCKGPGFRRGVVCGRQGVISGCVEAGAAGGADNKRHFSGGRYFRAAKQRSCWAADPRY